ncbi:MAG: two-component system phosphate regulon response regulator PhoB, partial [Zhongshania aliphaticivorans]
TKSKTQAYRILIVDDEPDVTELIKYKLEQEGYRCEVLNEPLKFVGRAREFQPDLILLDIMMPDLNGMQLCHIAKADSVMKQIPIIFLTARNEAEDRVKGLEAGADDYVSKPFNTRELLLRVDKVLSRSSQASIVENVPTRIQIGGVILDEETHQVIVDGEEVILTATEFRLLKLLMERKGRVQSRENLLKNVWNYDSEIETRTVDTHVRRLREKLGAYAGMIKTMRGVGYRTVDL